MSIKSGQRYKFENEEDRLVLDLFGTHDNSIIRHPSHGGENQQVTNVAISIARPSYNRDTLQWITEKQDDGQWTIQSISGQKYLGFEHIPNDGTPLFGLNKPQLWDIEVLSDSEDDDNLRVKYVFITYPASDDCS